MDHIPSLALLVPIVAVISVFTFISIASWSDARRKEREAYYKSETIKKIAELQGSASNSALEFLREEDRIATRRAREGMKVGGLVTSGVGIGLMLFLGSVAGKDAKGVFLVGAMPFLVGVALLVYVYLLATKE